MRRAFEPGGLELVGRERRCHSRSLAIARSPSSPTIETTTPFRPIATGRGRSRRAGRARRPQAIRPDHPRAYPRTGPPRPALPPTPRRWQLGRPRRFGSAPLRRCQAPKAARGERSRRATGREGAEDQAGHRRTIVPWKGNERAAACGRSFSAACSERPPCSQPPAAPRRCQAASAGRVGRLRGRPLLPRANRARADRKACGDGLDKRCRKDPLLLSERAYLRVSLSERTRFRALPADGRRTAAEV
jgi:hypothetical protein